jgi:hypothetical protein
VLQPHDAERDGAVEEVMGQVQHGEVGEVGEVHRDQAKDFVVLEMELSEATREAVDNRWDHSSDLVPSDAELLQICAVCQGRKERLEVGVVLWTL